MCDNLCGKGFQVIVNYAVTTPYFREIDFKENEFTPRGWAKLVEAVKQRNSIKGMSQLELIGEPLVESDEESDEESGESDEESGESDEESADDGEQNNS